MTSITVVVPGVVVLIGPAGVGKSTFAARHFRPDEILSSDELRGAIRGDPTDQTVTRVAFRILHRELAKRLADGQLVVVDATNLTRAARLSLLRAALATGVQVTAIVLVAPAALVHARNAGRGTRTVPADVVDRHLAAAAALGETEAEIEELLRAEGFAAVHVVATDGVLVADEPAIVRVRRRPTHP
jgi:protein phosphatase